MPRTASRHPLALMIVASATLVAACTSGPSDRSAPSHGEGTAADEQAPLDDLAAEDPDERPERSLRELAPQTVGPLTEPVRERSVGCDPDRFAFVQDGCQPAGMIELSELVTGGPSPDAIPSIDEPRFESVDEAGEWLDDRSPVVVLDHAGVTRLYPLEILIRHEIVNDRIGDTAVAVTYCPLCNSALAFERTMPGPDGPEVLEFGTTGRLWRSNLVMYDRQHLGLWSQFTGQSIVGERFLGDALTRLPTSLLGFRTAAELVPEAEVLSRDTGLDVDYQLTPYVSFDQEDARPGFLRHEPDDRLPPMTRVVGIGRGSTSVAVLLDHLRAEEVVELTLDGDPVTVWWTAGQASVLGSSRVESGRELGQTVVHLAEHEGRRLSFEPAGEGRFVDRQTGSTWDLRGHAVDGPLGGAVLEPIASDDVLWFAWAVYRPDTTIVGER
jgi:hypothetical protein